MLYEIPDLTVDDSEPPALVATDRSRATTNGHHALVVDGSEATSDGFGSPRSDKVRAIKPKSSGGKFSVVKSANGTKSNGTKSSKGKSFSKSKASKEKMSVQGPVDLLVDAPDPPTPPLHAPFEPSMPEPAIPLSTAVPETGAPSVERLDDRRTFVRDNRLPLILGFVAICLAVALALTTFQLTNRNSQLASKNALENGRTAALSAARTYAVELASYDYRTLGTDFAKVEGNSTPSFQQTYSKAGNVLKSILIKYDSVAKATLLSAGLVSATATRAVVVVFLEQTITNTSQKTPTSTRTQIEMTLDYSHGKWLIDDVTVF